MVDELPESQLDPVAKILASRGKAKRAVALRQHTSTRLSTNEEWGEPEMVGLPEHLKTFEDGTPVPNWVAGLDEVRSGR